MTWTVTRSPLLKPSIRSFAAAYNVSTTQIMRDIFMFTRFKEEHPTTPWPMKSADKPSGMGRGRPYNPYLDNNVYHCHLDYKRGDPLLVYRAFPAEMKIRILCITDHTAMFGNNRDEFVRQYASELPNSKPRR
jgi:hypothetical protein